MIKKLDDDLFSNDVIIFVYEDSNYVTLFIYEMSIFSVDLNKINFNVNFDGDHLETIIHVRIMVWSNRFKQRKAF